MNQTEIIKPPSTGKDKIQPLVRRGKKVGRNDKCTCGSGKKYKHCCLPKITVEKKKSFKRQFM